MARRRSALRAPLSRVIEHYRARHMTWRDKLKAGTGPVELAAADVVAVR